MSNEHNELAMAFMLALLRISLIVALVPIPGWRRSPHLTKAVLAVALAVTVVPAMGEKATLRLDGGALVAAALSELGLGLLFGLVTALVLEAFSLGAQLLGVQAGFSYASTIDPSSEADSGILPVIAQLMAGLLFFALRMDGLVLRALLQSFELYPPGQWAVRMLHAEYLIRLGAEVFAVALRLAFPIVALLMLLDLAVGVLGRIQTNIQLLTLSFPAKLVITLAALALLAPASPYLLRRHVENMVLLWPR